MKHLKKDCYVFFLMACCFFVSCSTNKKLSKEPAITSLEATSLKKKYSSLLSVKEQQIESLPLYSLIDEWYGTPYKYGSCDKNGIDCSNFIGIIYQQIYHQSISGSSSSIFNQCTAIAKNELREGDLLFFKIGKRGISHVGMYLQNNKFVHATTKKGVMINDLDEPYYTAHFYKAGRLK